MSLALTFLHLVCLKFYVFTAKLDMRKIISFLIYGWLFPYRSKYTLSRKKLLWNIWYYASNTIEVHIFYKMQILDTFYFLFTCFYHIDDAMQCYSCHDIKEKCFDPWNYDQFPKQTCPSRCFMCYVGKCLHLAIAKLCLPKTRKVSKSV